MQQIIYVTAPFPAQLEAAARLEAARRRISRAELVRQAVAEFLQRTQARARAAQGVGNEQC